MNERCCVFATVHLWEDSQHSVHRLQHADLPTRHKHTLVYTHMLAQRVRPDKLLLSNSHPFIYQAICPLSLPTSLSIHSFSSPTLIEVYPEASSSPIAVCLHKSQQLKDWKDREEDKKEEQKTWEGGETLVRVSFIFSPLVKNSAGGIHLRPTC